MEEETNTTHQKTIAIDGNLMDRFNEAKKAQSETFGFALTNKQFFTLMLDYYWTQKK
jgi:hypothetical protein